MEPNVVFRSSNKTRIAFRFTDQIPVYMNSNVVYKYKSNIFNDVYIRETKRLLLIPYYEHLGRFIIAKKPLKNNKKDATAVRKHSHLQNHPGLEMAQIITMSN